MGLRVFIGSSREAEDAMDELASWIEDLGHHPKPWTDPDLFPLASTTFDSLHSTAQQVDAAVFLFGEDDAVWYRGDKALTPRDNVLIEYGLFSGALGDRSVAIGLLGEPKLATDLLGMTCLPLAQKARAKLKLKHWLAEVGSRSSNARHGTLSSPFFTTPDPEDREFEFTYKLGRAKSLDLLGYSMAHMFATSKTQIGIAVAKGLRARVMILDPLSTAGKLMAEKVGDYGRVREPHERSIRYIKEIIEIARSGEARGTLQVKYVPWIPSCYLNIVDASESSGVALIGLNSLVLGSKLPRRIHFILEKSRDVTSFGFFAAQFEALWNSIATEPILNSTRDRV